MEHSTKAFVPVFVAAVMMPILCMAKNKSHSSWKRLPDIAQEEKAVEK